MGRRVTSVRLAEAVPSYSDQDLQNFVGEGQVDLKMPGFRKSLTNEQIKDIIAFIRTWGKK
jgi:mono/diheme cytochrome c family protein